MKKLMFSLVVLLGCVGCRTAYQYVVRIDMKAPPRNLVVWQAQYQCDASSAQTKTFPIDLQAQAEGVPIK